MEDNYSIVMGFAIHQHELAIDIHVSTLSWIPFPPPHPVPLGCPRAPTLGALLHASNLHWSSVLHMVIYMFECYSLTSHPCLLPYSPKVCSLYLCILMSCIKCHCYHLSKFHVYALIYCVGVSLSDFTLYNRLQFHPPH